MIGAGVHDLRGGRALSPRFTAAKLHLEEPIREMFARASAQLVGAGFTIIEEGVVDDQLRVRWLIDKDARAWAELGVFGDRVFAVSIGSRRAGGGRRIVTYFSEQSLELDGIDAETALHPPEASMREAIDRHRARVAGVELEILDADTVIDRAVEDGRADLARLAKSERYAVRDQRVFARRGSFDVLRGEHAGDVAKMIGWSAALAVFAWAIATYVPQEYVSLAAFALFAGAAGPAAYVFSRSPWRAFAIVALPAAAVFAWLGFALPAAWAGGLISAYLARSIARAASIESGVRANSVLLVILALLAYFAAPHEERPRKERVRPQLEPIAVRVAYSGEEMVHAFSDGVELDWEGSKAIARQREAGVLVLPTGKFTATDAFSQDGAPFELALEPGKYRVFVTVLETEHDRRVAFARIRVAEGRPERWMASGKKHVSAPIAIDSGTASFYDTIVTRQPRSESANDELLEQLTGDDHSLTASVTIGGTGGANIIAFSSGIGDGGYPVMFGYDAADRLVAVVAHFALLGEAPEYTAERAIEESTDMIERYPELDHGYRQRGQTHAFAGDAASALADFERAGKSYEVLLARGELFAEHGHAKRALEACTAAVDKADDLGLPYGVPMMKAMELGRESKALLCRVRAKLAMNDRPGAYADLDEVIVREKKIAREMESFLEQAKRHAPPGTSTAAFARLRQNEEAPELLRTSPDPAAIAKAIRTLESEWSRGALAVLEASPPDAARIPVLEKALARSKDAWSFGMRLRAVRELIRAKAATGDREGAKRAIDAALEEFPRAAKLYRARADLADDDRQALADLDKAVEYSARSPEALRARANVHEKLGAPESAAKDRAEADR